MVSSLAREVLPADPPGGSSSADTVDAALYDATNRLVDSLLHDARNPLNALSINLEVLTEKLKDETGTVPARQLKNLTAMRDQVTRVDQVLRQYAEFIAPRSGGRAEDLSALLTQAVALLSHESRVKRLRLTLDADPEVRVAMGDATELRLICLQPIIRGIERAAEGGEVAVSLKRAGAIAFLVVADNGPESAERFGRGLAALEQIASRNNASLRVAGGELRLSLPVV